MKALRVIFSMTIAVIFVACNSGSEEVNERLAALEARIELEESSKQGLGSSMNQVQIYHAKFFFAMKNENTDLMKYVLHELEESFEDVVENHGVHDDVNIAELADNTVFPALAELESKVSEGQGEEIEKGFEYLTVTCNKCHFASGHPFIRIRNPEGESYLNQDFTNP